MTLKEKVKSTIKPFIQDNNKILSLFLHGSVNTGRETSESDIDLGLLLEPGITLSTMDRVELGNKLSYELGRVVDLGIISSKNLIYASEALFKGDIIYTKDLEKTNLIRANILGLYFQFNLDRKEILDAYRA